MSRHLTVENDDGTIRSNYVGVDDPYGDPYGTPLSTSKTSMASLTMAVDTVNTLYCVGDLDVPANWQSGIELKGIFIGNRVQTIGNSAFSNIYLSTIENSLVLPKTLTSIGDSAFRGSKFQGTLTIPDSVTYIGEYAFLNSFVSGVASPFNLTIPAGITEIDIGAFQSCTAINGTLMIPGNITTIYTSAFSGDFNITGLDIQDGVLVIGDSAFDNCYGITTINIPSSVTLIDENAFGYCSGITEIYADVEYSVWNGAEILLGAGSVSSKLYVPADKIAGYGGAGYSGFQYFEGTVEEWTSYPDPMP